MYSMEVGYAACLTVLYLRYMSLRYIIKITGWADLLAGCRSTTQLIAACMRHAKNLLNLDLAPCTHWLRFVDVHYQRPPTSSSPDAMETAEARAHARESFCCCLLCCFPRVNTLEY